MKVAEAIVNYLKQEGVHKIFGIPGGAIMHLIDQIDQNEDFISYVLCRHEGGAAFIADGYSRVSNKLGVLAVTSGPGATNALAGLTNANRSGSAVMLIAGESPRKHFGKGFLQDGLHMGTDIPAVFQNAMGFGKLISSEEHFHTLFKAALRHSLGTPRRASFISLPDDVSASEIPENGPLQIPSEYRLTNAIESTACLKVVKKIFHELSEAKRPLILLGNGARESLRRPELLQEFINLVDTLGIAVATTANAKGIFPEDHALSLRNFGLAGCLWAQSYIREKGQEPYDVILVLGSSLSQLGTQSWDPQLRPTKAFYQVDLNPTHLGRVYPLTKGIVADCGAIINSLIDFAKSIDISEDQARKRKDFILQMKERVSPIIIHEKTSDSSNGLSPVSVMTGLQKRLPDGTRIFVDAGNCFGWSLHYLVIKASTEIHYSLGDGPMGFGVAGVIGGKIADPERPCVAIVGDGSFLMHGTEVSTATAQGISPIWIVLNDNDHSMVRQGMNHYFPRQHSWKKKYELGRPDLAEFAKSMGAQVYTVHDHAELDLAYKNAFAAAEKNSGPQVIVVAIDPQFAPPYYPTSGEAGNALRETSGTSSGTSADGPIL